MINAARQTVSWDFTQINQQPS
uniref:Uncharacterized protein n=1 Tax=Nelumbo nucifera TaxID=4432 RepID=A0A822ZDF2_NELNU|nr:TPA_asm: hypothetical protein HUJ06_001157 [Nelumbo nucifera]